METAEKELTLEEAFLRLEEVTRALEDENISLEESFTVYQKGMELLKYCNESIAVSYTHLTLPTTERV